MPERVPHSEPSGTRAPGPDPAEARRLVREASLELTRLRRIRGASHRTWRRIARARARLAFAAALLAAALAEPALAGTPIFRRGPFTPVLTHATPTFADIDGDGDLDGFVGERVGQTVLFENFGTPEAAVFGASRILPFGLRDVGLGSAPVFADIDGDGDLDAFVGSYAGNTVFFSNSGSAAAPTFAAPITNPFGLADVGVYASPAFADLDGDGDLDAFVGEEAGTTVFFENSGTASTPAFAAPATNPFGLADVFFHASPEFADLDGDGDLDAFVGESDGSTIYFANTGSTSAPAFAAPSPNPFGLADVGSFGSRASPSFADLDGDGDLDAFVGEAAGTAVFFENIGSASAPAFAAAFGLAPVPVSPVSSLVGHSASPSLADIDADGDADAFVGDSRGRTNFFENTGTASLPGFAPASTEPFGLVTVGGTHASPDFADIDGDGDLDGFVGKYWGNTIFFSNTGGAAAPAFAPPVTNPFGLADVGFFATPALADIDGDGDLDAFSGGSSTGLIFFENTGTVSEPTFAAPSTNPFGLVVTGYRNAPTFVDVDGDGDLDAFVGTGPGRTLFFENTGTASAAAFAAPSTNPFGLVTVDGDASPALADVDADGDLDAFIGQSNGTTAFFENLELGPGTCIDGLDNDGDGLRDATDDPGCSDESDTSETSSLQCDNGLDDDGDGKIDWRSDGGGDPDCSSLTDGSEFPPSPAGCGIGPELLLLAPLLTAARRRR